MADLPESRFNDPDRRIQVEDWYRIRQAMEHENLLVNHRQTWLLNSQAFLFAAFSIIYATAVKSDTSPQHRSSISLVLTAICLLGMSISVIIQQAIRYAEIQGEALRVWWTTKYGETYSAVLKDQVHPPIMGYSDSPLRAKFAPSNLPIMFIMGWISSALITLVFISNPGPDVMRMIGLWSLRAILVGGGFALGYAVKHKRHP